MPNTAARHSGRVDEKGVLVMADPSQWRAAVARHRDGLGRFTVTAVLDRFMAFVEPEPNTGCWLWSGDAVRGGYGRFVVGKQKLLAHRWAFAHFRGPIPPGAEIDHLCRIRCCVNPSHLEPVSHTENMARGFWATRTRCRRGHRLSGDNLRLSLNPKNGRTVRVCRACRELAMEAYHARQTR